MNIKNIPSGTYLFTCPNCGEKIQKGLSPKTLEAMKNSSLFKERDESYSENPPTVAEFSDSLAAITQQELKELSIDEELHDKFRTAISGKCFSDIAAGRAVEDCIRVAQQHTNSKLKEFVINFLNWITNEDSPYAILYGNQAERFATNDEDLTSKQVYEKYLDSLKQQS